MKKWNISEAQELFSLPLPDLLYKAQTIHRENFVSNQIQISTLLSIKTGACAENCSYCPQSGHYSTGVAKKELSEVDIVVEAAKKAKAMGSTRFCMGAAWRSPKNSDLEKICAMIKEIKDLGMETCATLGLLNQEQANKLKESGLDYYNHNIDTSPEYYSNIITTRTFNDRVDTLENVRKANIKICCGGIIGMGEDNLDRIKMLVFLANMPSPPESVPINKLIRIKGTPLENQKDIDNFDFIRTVALARILMPKSYVRLSAGREQMSEELQFLCFLAGANSMFYGEQLLTADNNLPENDDRLFYRVGLKKLINRESHIE